MTFYPFDRFILRTPLFPMASNWINSDIFKEALYLASPELYEGNKSNNPKKQQKYHDAILKYYSRACTRCTPFGLFAGCSIGKISDTTDIELHSPINNKRVTRLDMQYLCALIQKIERESSIRSQLHFYPNNSLYSIGGQYRYIKYDYHNTLRFHNTMSLEIDEALKIVLLRAQQGATINELSQLFIDDGISQEEAIAYIEDIIDSQILKSELDPCIVGEDVLHTLISKLSKLKNVQELDLLKDISMQLAEIDAKPIGTTIADYKKIIHIITQLGVPFDAKYLFQTDVYKPVKKAQISSYLIKQISHAIEILAQIRPHRENSNLEQFKQDFIARYDTAEIPLAQVLDNELSIGYASSKGKDINPLIDDIIMPNIGTYWQDTQYTPIDQLILDKYIDCIRNNESVIMLTDNDFKGYNFTPQFHDTISVMCSILPKDMIYIKSAGGSSAANLVGRFCHIDNGIREIVQEIADFEQHANSDKIVAEISHLPESRIGNITSRPIFRNYVIHYLSNSEKSVETIPISDIMLSVKDNRLFLRSKKYNKEIIPRLTCAHNYSLSHIPMYRFLCDMQHQGIMAGIYLNWNSFFNQVAYLPRIQYNKIILTRQRWKLVFHHNIEQLSQLKNWCRSHKIPRYVVIPDADNELFIDLSKDEYLCLLLSMLKKRKTLFVEEFLFDHESAVIKQEGQHYTNECILFFHK